MKKSTLRRLQAQTSTEATASNLNRIQGKRDARNIVSMDNEAAADYVKKIVKATGAEFTRQFEAAQWLGVDTKAVRMQIKSITIDDIEGAKTVTGTVDVRKLVSKAVARVNSARIKAEKAAEKAAQSEADKQARAEARRIEKAAEKAEKAAACWF